MRVAVFAVLLMISSAAGAAAQDVGGYVAAGSGSIDYLVHREAIPQASAGVLWRAAGDRIRVGAEVDLLTSNGYFSGRGGPLVEFAPFRARVQPFLRGGYFVGEDSSWIAGGGLDIWLTERSGLRLFAQDAFRRLRVTNSFNVPDSMFHEPSFQIGWVWR